MIYPRSLSQQMIEKGCDSPSSGTPRPEHFTADPTTVEVKEMAEPCDPQCRDGETANVRSNCPFPRKGYFRPCFLAFIYALEYFLFPYIMQNCLHL